MTNPLTLVWFRQDLRLSDNPALHYAAQSGNGILPVFIFDYVNSGGRGNGAASNWWLHHALVALNKSLNNQLFILHGNPVEIIPELVATYQCEQVCWNRCYEPWRIHRDKLIKQKLSNTGTTVKSFNGSLLWEPHTVLKKDQTPYKVFTHYYRRGCLLNTPPRTPLPTPEELKLQGIAAQDQLYQGESGIKQLKLLPDIPWDHHFADCWQPGEINARNRLKNFTQKRAKLYKQQRDFPSVSGTSKLSPYLHFGEISVHQIWHAIWQSVADSQTNPLDNEDLDCYLSELGWREFSYYLLYHFPSIPESNFNPKFNHFPWGSSAANLKKWQRGQTGYPIVDAGMRELWQTGYMHNRVRMIVGSFLVKNLLIDWREGERWFWDCLVDADLAANTASWQWVAGSGADAAPYFRIFNPVTQGKKFDANGDYVRKFCPELRKLPEKYIHTPWEAPQNILDYAGIELGKTYPKPIVELSESRQKALDAFQQLKAITSQI